MLLHKSLVKSLCCFLICVKHKQVSFLDLKPLDILEYNCFIFIIPEFSIKLTNNDAIISNLTDGSSVTCHTFQIPQSTRNLIYDTDLNVTLPYKTQCVNPTHVNISITFQNVAGTFSCGEASFLFAYRNTTHSTCDNASIQACSIVNNMPQNNRCQYNCPCTGLSCVIKLAVHTYDFNTIPSNIHICEITTP